MWGDDFHGGPAYKGHCPICGESNGDVYDYECEDCIEYKCEMCGNVSSENLIHGVCSYCLQQSINELT